MAMNVAFWQGVSVVSPLECGRKIHPAKTSLPCLAYGQLVKWEGYCTGSTTKCLGSKKMQVCRKGGRHMRLRKNILLWTSWWKYAGGGCSRLHISPGLSRLPEKDADTVHRPEFSLAGSPNRMIFGGATIKWWAYHGNVTGQFNHLFYMLYRSCLESCRVLKLAPPSHVWI